MEFRAQLVRERLQRQVLGMKVLLDFEGGVQYGVRVLVGVLRPFVGGGCLHVLADDDDWQEDELFALVRRAFPFRNLTRREFDEIVAMLSDGIAARRGRYGAYLHHDQVNKRLRGRRGAKKAILAVAASMLTAAYHMLKNGVEYKDLGAGHFARRDRRSAVAEGISACATRGLRYHRLHESESAGADAQVAHSWCKESDRGGLRQRRRG